MAFGYDGSVRIVADLNHSPFDKGLAHMTGSVEKFGSVLKKVAGMVAVAFGTAAMVNFGKEAIQAASDLSDAWTGLQSIVEGQGKSFTKAKSFINDYISDGLVPLENAVTAYKSLAARGYNTEQIETTMTALKDAAAFGRQASYSLGEAVSSAAEGLKNENSILVDNAGVTKNVAKMWEDYAASIGTTANNLTQEQKIQAEVNGILEETRFQTGDAAKLVNTYSGQVAMLGFNFQQLKVQVGNALIPIARAVLPGINAIISALTKLAKVFAQVTALLFGKSAEVKATSGVASSAGAAADATDKLAGATEGAGSASKKAAKDMKGVLAGFDELNILATNAADSMDDAAGGMSGAGSDAGIGDLEIPSYESEIDDVDQLGKAYESLGELFNDALQSAIDALPALREALLNAAGSFNEFNQKLYDAFTFPGVKEKVEQLGRELAEVLNDFVLAIDWELWGRTLGAGLNLGLQFLTEFIYTFDWVNLGNKLAELINGLVYEVDWYDFGRLLWAKFKIGLETFAGFILGLDMPALAQAASNIIIGFFNSMEETIANIDWEGIGRQIAEFLNNIDWEGVLNSIAGAIGVLIPAALELIGGFIQNADEGTLIAAALFFGTKFLGFLLEKVISPIAKEVGSDLIKKIADHIASGDISGLITSVTSIFGKIKEAASTAISKIGEVIAKIGPSLAGIASILGGTVLAATSFFDMWNEGFSWAKEAVMLLGIALTAVGAIILGAPALVAGVIAAIVAAVATAAVVIKEHWEEIKAFFSELWENIKQLASDAWESIKGIWSAVSGWFSENIIEPLKTFFSEMWENIKQLASDAWDGIVSVWQAVSGWFNDNIITPVTNFFSEMWNSIKQWASEAWENIQNAWRSAGDWFRTNITEPIRNFFTDVWNVITMAASTAWEAIKSGVFGFWEDVKSWWSANVAKYFSIEYWKDLGSKMVSGLLDGLKGIFDGLKSWASDVWDSITSAFSTGNAKSSVKSGVNSSARRASSYSAMPEAVQAYSLPKLANGAVIPPNQQFAAILGDQRSGMNLEAPAGLIKQMVMEGMQAFASQSGGFGQGGNMTVVMEIDGREFGRASYKYGTAEQQRVGVRLTEVHT